MCDKHRVKKMQIKRTKELLLHIVVSILKTMLIACLFIFCFCHCKRVHKTKLKKIYQYSNHCFLLCYPCVVCKTISICHELVTFCDSSFNIIRQRIKYFGDAVGVQQRILRNFTAKYANNSRICSLFMHETSIHFYVS